MYFRHPYVSENRTLGLDFRHYTKLSEIQIPKVQISDTVWKKTWSLDIIRQCLKSELFGNWTTYCWVSEIHTSFRHSLYSKLRQLGLPNWIAKSNLHLDSSFLQWNLSNSNLMMKIWLQIKVNVKFWFEFTGPWWPSGQRCYSHSLLVMPKVEGSNLGHSEMFFHFWRQEA